MSGALAQAATLAPPPDGIDPGQATPFDSADGSSFVLPVAQGRSYVQLTATALFLLAAGRDGRPVSEVARQITSSSGQQVTDAEVVEAYRQVLDRVVTASGPRRSSRPGSWLVLPLVPGQVVARLAAVLAPLLGAWSVAAIAATAAVIPGVLFRRGLPAPSAGAAAAGYGVFVLVLLLHELGHAAATVRGGGTPRTIGFLLYLVWPCFYTDVTDSWRLSRPQRALVDAGGVVIQLLVTELCAVGWEVTGWEPLGYAVLLSLVSMLMTLNPLLRFDGYWLLGDALGVPDLQGSARAALRSYRRGATAARTGAAAIAGWRRAVLATWAVVAWLVWIGFAAWVLWSSASRWRGLQHGLAALRGPHAGQALPSLLGNAVALLIVVVLVGRVLVGLVLRLRSRRQVRT